MSGRSTPPVGSKVGGPTIESLRELALSQAAAWNDNEAGLRDTSNLMAWRDNCRDDVRDSMGVGGKMISDELLAAWVDTFDREVYGVGEAADDIECAIETVNDLLRLALDQLAGVTDNRADAAIRGAKRFIDDISIAAARLHPLGDGVGGGEMKYIPPPQLVNFTIAEKRIIAAFQAMDGRRKGEAVFYMEEIAKEFPCPLGPVPGGVK